MNRSCNIASRIVLIDKSSTSPVCPPTVTTSPTAMVSSMRINKPVIISPTELEIQTYGETDNS